MMKAVHYGCRVSVRSESSTTVLARTQGKMPSWMWKEGWPVVDENKRPVRSRKPVETPTCSLLIA